MGKGLLPSGLDVFFKLLNHIKLYSNQWASGKLPVKHVRFKIFYIFGVSHIYVLCHYSL